MKIRKIMTVSSPLVIALFMTGNVQAGWQDYLNNSGKETPETVEQGTQAIDKSNQAVEEASNKANQAVEEAGNKANQAVQTGAASNEQVSAPTQTGLIDALMQKLGVTQEQAQGGSGAIFQAAKQHMGADDFSQLSQSVPEMDKMLEAVPEQSTAEKSVTGALSSIMGDDETVNTATSLISAFQKLDLSQDMIPQFTPIVVDYVKQTGGEHLANLLQAALPGS